MSNFTIKRYTSYSSIILSLAGLLLAGMGLYFIFIRPPLLPEDLRYIAPTSQDIKANLPGLAKWLQKVFWVMGGYIFITGLLTIFLSFTSFHKHLPGAFIVVSLSGISSIGLMTVVNFIIDSDFKWLLFSFASLWAIALILNRLCK